MADRPEIGQPVHVSLGEMLPTLKEHSELCTVTPFPAIGLQLKLSYLENDLYEVEVYYMGDPPRLKRRDVVNGNGVAFRFAAMQVIVDMMAEKMAARGADEIERFLAQVSGE